MLAITYKYNVYVVHSQDDRCVLLFTCSLCWSYTEKLAVGCVHVVHSHDDGCVLLLTCSLCWSYTERLAVV